MDGARLFADWVVPVLIILSLFSTEGYANYLDVLIHLFIAYYA